MRCLFSEGMGYTKSTVNHKRHKHRHHSRFHQAPRRNRLALWVIPHAQNHYRPHIVRRYGLLAVLALLVGLQFVQQLAPYQSVLGENTAVTPDNILVRSNQARSDEGETPLRANAALTTAAKLKAEDMLQRQYWAHANPDGVQPWYWLEQAGYRYTIAGENLAKNFSTSDGVVKAWLASPSHRENLLGNRFTDIGVAVARGTFQGKPATIVVALYGAPATAVAAGAVSGDGTATSAVFRASPPTGAQIGMLERAAIALESLPLITTISVVVLLVIALIALMAHMVRHKLPRARRERWHWRHHGLIKSLGLTSIAVVVVLFYAGGQL